jgi:hypothetical protein
MLNCRTDEQHSTLTKEGRVPNIIARVGGYDLSLPVRIIRAKSNNGAAEAERDRFGYVYALPAGRKINLNGDIT